MKRTLDLIISINGCLILLPLMLFIALLIKIDSAGPIFFIQSRVGRHGNLFQMNEKKSC